MPDRAPMARSGFEKRFPTRDSVATKALAANVRRIRKEKGWTQDVLAAEIDVEQGFISRIENGRANPTLLVLETLATTLEVRVEQLFEVQAKSRRAKDR
ncbi:transcriptional regulator with XRE-family HTH domain [Bradyrhizobium sp. JR1.5]|uniref:helix-turn-helix domain-containing protein n=1 Tax=unclassified Bradyrhizobium TaxID=2631580 RepID=UPI0024472C9A|nr:helix-turn-helix transcriptional regulator [Bradyrhizobium sp. SSUT18]MDH2399210.1 helix-turn-helix transcriptional regulator [Bradyrhizobium sp. SSUT18]